MGYGGTHLPRAPSKRTAPVLPHLYRCSTPGYGAPAGEHPGGRGPRLSPRQHSVCQRVPRQHAPAWGVKVPAHVAAPRSHQTPQEGPHHPRYPQLSPLPPWGAIHQRAQLCEPAPLDHWSQSGVTRCQGRRAHSTC